MFGHDLRANGVVYESAPAAAGPPTGRCLIVVTPDAERTMSTFLGASAFFGPDDVDPEVVEAARITFLEGYLFDSDDAKAAYRRASDIAHAAGRRVALTLSDTFCVERHLSEWRTLVVDAVDVLFANEAELRVLYDDDLDRSVDRVRGEVGLACVTLGPDGSLLVTADGRRRGAGRADDGRRHDRCRRPVRRRRPVRAQPGPRIFAECGRLGSLAASAVISRTGARPVGSLAALM